LDRISFLNTDSSERFKMETLRANGQGEAAGGANQKEPRGEAKEALNTNT
jgi:hypothetical protein